MFMDGKVSESHQHDFQSRRGPAAIEQSIPQYQSCRRSVLGLHSRKASQPAREPGPVEIEATYASKYIQYLATHVQVAMLSALHGCSIDV